MSGNAANAAPSAHYRAASICYGVAGSSFLYPSWLHRHGSESYGIWYREHGSTEALITIGVSACLGLLVSLSTFLLIGATSALTYNIVGHTKTMMILVMGVVVFGDSVSSQKIGGIGLALCGVFWYFLAWA